MASPGRGRGGGRGGATQQPPIPAQNLTGPSAQYFYSRQYQDDVREQVLQADPDLDRRVQEEEDEGENYDVQDELWEKVGRILHQNFSQISAEEKMPYEQEALESKYDQWRRYREEGRLVENEESLAQKAQDEKLGITGPLNRGRGRGRGGGNANSSQHQQVTGTFIGGELLTPLQELTPPFDRNTLKMKTGKIDAEEYF